MTAPVLVARNVVAGYAPGLPIVQDASIEVAPGEVVTIVGPNGAGKSTLLKAIAGLVLFESGTILLDARDVAGLPAHEMVRLGVGFVPQTGNIFTHLTIGENLVVGGHTLPRAELRRRVARAYELTPFLGERRSSTGRLLSGGQRQILAVARALMTDPKLIMLDEPTAGLAPRAASEVFAHLRRLSEGGVAVLMVEQNAKAAIRASDRFYVLAEGRNRMQGRPQDLVDDDTAIGEAFLGRRRPAS
jgi:ABC-type branched-subunit amino acid transport system ATPase component